LTETFCSFQFFDLSDFSRAFALAREEQFFSQKQKSRFSTQQAASAATKH
jgi:hypothetical protein